MSSAIEIENLTKEFNGVRAVNDLSLQVPKGSIFGFLGPNGAGKTTTIKTLLGLLKPTSGRASVNGYDVQLQGEQVRQSIGYVSEAETMYGWMTASQLVSFCKSLYPRWNDAIVKSYLDAFGLPLKRKVRFLSKGMKAQLALTLSLGSDPQVLILDEPTSGLDPLARNEFLDHIVKEVAESGRTIFFSSHILSEVERVADWVAIINKGKLLVSGEIDELKQTEKVIRVVLEQDAAIEELIRIPGVMQTRPDGRAYRLTVRGNVEGVLDRLNQYKTKTVEVIDLNLEDIFMEHVKEVV